MRAPARSKHLKSADIYFDDVYSNCVLFVQCTLNGAANIYGTFNETIYQLVRNFQRNNNQIL